MVAILFLVGQGLEPPTIISELLDVQKNPCKPTYDMASDTPLVLWDCVFPQEGDEDRKDAIQWLYVGDEMGAGDAKYGSGGLIEDLWEVWRERKVDEILAGSLVDVVVKQGSAISELTSKSVRKGPKSQKVFDGDDRPRLQGNYIPVMKKPRMDTVQAINEKYAVRKGFDNAEDMRIQGYKRLNKPSVIIDDADE
jgi:tRNA pseudouridine38/39 synthase